MAVKALIPLRGADALQEPLGVLVVDAAHREEPVGQRDLDYLQLLGMLVVEILERDRQ